jgi:site-specific recombinase XerD
MAHATTLQSGQIRHLFRFTAATSRHPERDCLVLWLGLTAGMRVTEIAQIEVQDVLFPSGALRDEVSLREAITKGCRQRWTGRGLQPKWVKNHLGTGKSLDDLTVS